MVVFAFLLTAVTLFGWGKLAGRLSLSGATENLFEVVFYGFLLICFLGLAANFFIPLGPGFSGTVIGVGFLAGLVVRRQPGCGPDRAGTGQVRRTPDHRS